MAKLNAIETQVTVEAFAAWSKDQTGIAKQLGEQTLAKIVKPNAGRKVKPVEALKAGK